MPLLTPCPVPGVINLCCSSQSGTGGWMPNGKKSASRQLSAKWSAVDSYKHPAAPPAVNRAGTKPCCSLWKCSTKKATGKAALAPLQRCGTVPAALPMHPDCTGSSTLQGGMLRSWAGSCPWAGAALSASSSTVELPRFLLGCALPEGKNWKQTSCSFSFIIWLV